MKGRRGLLARPVGLYDIDDVEAFVAATLERSGLRLSRDEKEELLAEGICILFELAGTYRPRMTGYRRNGRFSGYAARFLPNRLTSAWHARHPEHRYTTDGAGGRLWRYEAPPVSLDADDAPTPIAAGGTLSAIDAALTHLAPWERMGARRMVVLLEEGFGWDEIADRLNISRSRLSDLRDRLEAAIGTVHQEEERVGCRAA